MVVNDFGWCGVVMIKIHDRLFSCRGRNDAPAGAVERGSELA